MIIDFDGPVRARQAAWCNIAETLAARADAAELLALGQGFVLTTDGARRVGFSNADTRRRVYRGQWSVVHRGVLSVLPAGDDAAPGGASLEVRAAGAALVRPGTVISLASAAAAYGLPVYGRPGRPELTSAHIPKTADRGGARIYAAALHDSSRWFGAPITTVARTVVDQARHGRRSGLMAADAALHERLVGPAQLDRELRRASGWPGIRRARTVLALASEKVESPLESLIRLLLFDHDVPLPEPQVWIGTSRGHYRVDGLYADRWVIIEADGMLKYRAGRDAHVLEKLRQEHLERAGYRVVRITWDDVVRDPLETVARVRYALRNGGPGLSYCSA